MDRPFPEPLRESSMQFAGLHADNIAPWSPGASLTDRIGAHLSLARAALARMSPPADPPSDPGTLADGRQ